MRSRTLPGRTTAAASGDVVVFLIGMRVNHLWAVHRWPAVLLAMLMMLRELSGDRSLGLLHHIVLIGSPRAYYVVQYWESKDKLLAYAAASDRRHRPWWGRYNRLARKGGRHVGIWHETYIVPEGSYENMYGDMPPYGLGQAYGTAPLRDGVHAQERLRGSAAA
ncbi:DUF4188 domain-containing protein [Streptomyces xantholiticus]|uniref:DUF4188 domain-containing protein n=1 Tax=Streptomyces xantholiticus TaxID=68285 RepID=UPI001678FB2C|nr:DUF4188 domain-containing protein [Streptomyces xantholiticus]GGW58113.1 hypothetical protein GCM10010381_49280 [Streptomyces xantholiticus]